MSDFFDQKQLVDSELITIKDVNSFINRRFKTEDGAHYFFMKIIEMLVNDNEKLHLEIENLKKSIDK